MIKYYDELEVWFRLFLTSVLDGGGWSASSPGRLPPEKSPRYQFDRRLLEPQNRSGRGGEEKNSLPFPGIEPRSSSL